MRTVRAYRLRDYFNRGDGGWSDLQISPYRGVNQALLDLFYRRRHLFQPISLAIVLLLLTGLAALGSRPARIAFATQACVLAGLYLQARAIARGLVVSRRVPTQAVERERLELEFEIRNCSGFAAHDLLLLDRFTGSTRHEVEWSPETSAPPGTVVRGSVWLPCDAGMGTHRFGPLDAVITDLLGIFHFTVTEDRPDTIEILPELLPAQGFTVPAALESSSAGLNESAKRGDSSSFLGTREYVSGDPIRRLNWKLSARAQELIINEFESSVNTDLTICLDLEPSQQIGRKAQSTWEHLKDALVSLVHDPIPGVNRIQLLSQGLRIPFGSGADHAHLLVHRISAHAPSAGSGLTLLEECHAHAPYGSSLLYLGSVYQRDAMALGLLLEQFLAKGVSVSAILADARSFTAVMPAELAHSLALAARNAQASEILARILAQNDRLGIPTRVLELKP
jgi:uncharacterized protein (DUF58 family)